MIWKQNFQNQKCWLSSEKQKKSTTRLYTQKSKRDDTKMKIKNNSKWNTQDLKALLVECFSRAGMEHRFKAKSFSGRQVLQDHVVEIGHGHYSGCAQLNSKWMKIRVPTIKYVKGYAYGADKNGNNKEILNDTKFDSKSFAHTAMHELAHCRGIDHKDMTDDFDTSWANGFQVRPQETKKLPDRVAQRRNIAIENVKRYQNKLKRTANLLKKWQKKANYYENKQKSN